MRPTFEVWVPFRDRTKDAKRKHKAAVAAGLLDRGVKVVYKRSGEYEVVRADVRV